MYNIPTHSTDAGHMAGGAPIIPTPPHPVRPVSNIRAFVLERDEDASGVSGTGTVAEGVEFTSGAVVLEWITGSHRSTVVWDSIDSVIAIHGHGGLTRVVWVA